MDLLPRGVAVRLPWLVRGATHWHALMSCVGSARAAEAADDSLAWFFAAFFAAVVCRTTRRMDGPLPADVVNGFRRAEALGFAQAGDWLEALALPGGELPAEERPRQEQVGRHARSIYCSAVLHATY